MNTKAENVKRSSISPTTCAVADLLRDIGWRNPNDAQLTELDTAIFSRRLVTALFSSERHLRDYMDAEKVA